MATRDLIVRVLGDSKSLERTFVKSSATGKVFGREMEVVGRKVDKSFAGLRGLASGRGLAGGLFAASALAGLKQIVGAASNSQQVLGQTRVALEDAGLSWDRYGASVEAAAASLTKLGFDDEETLKVIATFSRATGDVNKALDLAALSADVARARYVDLASASTIVLKASLGQAGALRRIGIDAKTGSSGLQLLALLSEKYGGAASAASGDAATANDRLRVSLQNVQEQIGSGLLPQVTAIAVSLAAATDGASRFAKALADVKAPSWLGGNTADRISKEVVKGLLFWPLVAEQFGPKNKADAAAAGKDLGAAGAKAFADAFGLAALQEAGKTAGPGTFGKPGTFPIPAAADRKPRTAEQRNRFFDNALTRSLDRAQDGSLKEQVAKLRAIEATLQKRIDATKDVTRKLNLEDQLVQVGRQRKSVEQQIADVLSQRVADAKAAQLERKAKELARVQAAQFRALGLSAAGGDVVPGVENLRKQLASLTGRLAGSSVHLSSKLKAELAGVRKVLSGELGKATVESRQRIQELFATIRGEFEKGAKGGTLTKTTSLNSAAILAGLGLSRDEERRLRSRLSHFNSSGVALAGATGTTASDVKFTISIDGRPVEHSVTRNQQKRARANPAKRRGGV